MRDMKTAVKYHRYNSIGCSGVIAFFIGLIVTAILLCVSMPLIKSFGADAGKLIFLTVGILAAVGVFYCWRQYDDTLVMIKWMWWEFLMAICFWIAFAFTVFYFKVDDLFNADGTSKDQNVETLKESVNEG